MKPGFVRGFLLLWITLFPVLASAQCTPGMMSGGHDHGQTAPSKAVGPSSDAVRDLLSRKEGRSAMLEAVLADPRFMRSLIDRMLAAPEWRSLMRERLAVGSAPADSVALDSIPAPAPAPRLHHEGH